MYDKLIAKAKAAVDGASLVGDNGNVMHEYTCILEALQDTIAALENVRDNNERIRELIEYNNQKVEELRAIKQKYRHISDDLVMWADKFVDAVKKDPLWAEQLKSTTTALVSACE